MDIELSNDDLSFEAEVREFLAGNAYKDGEDPNKWRMDWFEKARGKGGWDVPKWPAKFGGPGWTPNQHYIWQKETARSSTPWDMPFGLSMLGPVLMAHGSEEQQERFLPDIRARKVNWCQGYSEPNAGSDLASLKMRAEDDGKGNFVLNGQKTWTTYAQHADWIFLLVRTDPDVKKQAGISFLLADMKTPGITVKPFLTTGGTPAFCETFFDDAVVPKENLVGPLNGGWTMAKALLGHERTMIAAVGTSTRAIQRIKRIAASTIVDGKPMLEQPAIRDRIARHEIKLEALRMANYRAVAGAQTGHAPGAESSILKIRGSEIMQECFEMAMDVMGHNSLEWFNDAGNVPPLEQWVPSAFNYTRATTIYGGSNEIQRNIIAKLILGLPMR